MDREEAKRKLRAMLMRCSIAYTPHAKARMVERKITAQDVLKALHGGVMVGEPEEVRHCKGFKCKMQVRRDDGRVFEIPVFVDEDNIRIIVITAVRKK